MSYDARLDRTKFVSSKKFTEQDIVKIRWQAAQPPNGEGVPLSIIAQAYDASYETIRKIVTRQSYSWIGKEFAPLPADPRVAKALLDTTVQSWGESKNWEELAAKIAVAVAPDTSPATPQLTVSSEIASIAAGYGARVQAPVAVPLDDAQPAVEGCEYKDEFGLACAFEKGHVGEHSV